MTITAMTGFVIRVFQDTHGTWTWEITKPYTDDERDLKAWPDRGHTFDVPWNNLGTRKVSGVEKTLARAAEKAADKYGEIIALEVECQLKDAYREARPVARVEL